MSQADILLVDNGSKRAAATLRLRAIANALSTACGEPVHAVSLQHADKIPPADLEGRPAQLLAGVLRDRLAAGRRDFILLPLLFGKSRALTAYVPQLVAELTGEFGAFDLRVADELVPLPEGEPLLVEILEQHIAEASARLGDDPTDVVLVDHGSPSPDVTAVRNITASQLCTRLPRGVRLAEAVMERRPGAEYDFNGPLLGHLLRDIATAEPEAAVVVAMMFLGPGRHAGPGGDVAEICADAQSEHPGLRIVISPLIGEHPRLIDLLCRRLEAAH